MLCLWLLVDCWSDGMRLFVSYVPWAIPQASSSTVWSLSLISDIATFTFASLFVRHQGRRLPIRLRSLRFPHCGLWSTAAIVSLRTQLNSKISTKHSKNTSQEEVGESGQLLRYVILSGISIYKNYVECRWLMWHRIVTVDVWQRLLI